MRTGRPKAELVVTSAERETLERWARRPKTAQALAQRARIVMGCATGATNRAVATRFGVTEQMVGKWRARFVGRRLDGLLDEPRPGAPRADAEPPAPCVSSTFLAGHPAAWAITSHHDLRPGGANCRAAHELPDAALEPAADRPVCRR
jgi:helix-turn-helix protein